jgi:hypothetical protein
MQKVVSILKAIISSKQDHQDIDPNIDQVLIQVLISLIKKKSFHWRHLNQ